jgi:entericidin B
VQWCRKQKIELNSLVIKNDLVLQSNARVRCHDFIDSRNYRWDQKPVILIVLATSGHCSPGIQSEPSQYRINGWVGCENDRRVGNKTGTRVEQPSRFADGSHARRNVPTPALIGLRNILGSRGYRLELTCSKPEEPHKGTSIMRKNLSIALTLLVLVGIAPLLGACNTTAGVGRDISDGGHVITHDANVAK